MSVHERSSMYADERSEYVVQAFTIQYGYV